MPLYVDKLKWAMKIVKMNANNCKSSPVARAPGRCPARAGCQSPGGLARAHAAAGSLADASTRALRQHRPPRTDGMDGWHHGRTDGPCSGSSTSAAQLVLLPAPTDLRVESLAEQYATISVAAPRFSFQHGRQPSSLPRGTSQASYWLTVAAAGSNTLLWGTHVASTRCSQIEYTGAPLPPFGRFVWTAQ